MTSNTVPQLHLTSNS